MYLQSRGACKSYHDALVQNTIRIGPFSTAFTSGPRMLKKPVALSMLKRRAYYRDSLTVEHKNNSPMRQGGNQRAGRNNTKNKHELSSCHWSGHIVEVQKQPVLSGPSLPPNQLSHLVLPALIYSSAAKENFPSGAWLGEHKQRPGTEQRYKEGQKKTRERSTPCFRTRICVMPPNRFRSKAAVHQVMEASRPRNWRAKKA